MTDILSLDATALLNAYRRGTISPVEAINAVLEAAERHNPVVNALCLIDHVGARRSAQASEARWMRGEPMGELDGVPVTLKDALPWKGFPNRGGSKTSSPDPVDESAPAVEDLLEAGAIPIGKTTMSEFGWKALGDSPLYGIARNPWDTRMTCGGSSGGAAVAAALNLGMLHAGMDSAGSIRVPSSFCGVFGLKPSHGRVPSNPPLPFALISDVGPITRSVRDAALMLTVMADPDPRDIWTVQAHTPDYRVGLEDGIRGMRIAWSPRLGFVRELDEEVEQICAQAVRAFEDLGAIVEEADPKWDDPIDVMRMLWLVGSWIELSGVDPSRRGECDPGLVAFARPGEKVLAAEFLDKANGRMALFRAMSEFHHRYDLLLTPTVATAAFEVGHNTPPDGRCGDEWFNWSKYSYPFDLTLQPVATVPCGQTRSGLPVGLQIAGPFLCDGQVLKAARAFETARPWEKLVSPRS